MNKPFKVCNKIGCNNLTRESYCESHKDEKQVQSRRYDVEARDKNIVAFYKSKEWKQMRMMALVRDNYICMVCKEEHNRTRPAAIVDHQIEIRDDWEKRLMLDNLKSMCHACHNKKTAKERARRSKQ